MTIETRAKPRREVTLREIAYGGAALGLAILAVLFWDAEAHQSEAAAIADLRTPVAANVDPSTDLSPGERVIDTRLQEISGKLDATNTKLDNVTDAVCGGEADKFVAACAHR